MNYRDSPKFRKLERRKQAHKAIMKTNGKTWTRSSAEKNILSPDPKITKNITFW